MRNNNLERKDGLISSGQKIGVEIMSDDFFDFFEKVKEKKEVRTWDCVIGNPPYQNPKNRKNAEVNKGVCGSTLWDKFISSSFEICNIDGICAFISPGQWRKPDHKLFDLFREKDVKYVEIHNMNDGLKQFGVQTGYDITITKNSITNRKTIIVDDNGNSGTYDLSSMPFIPNSLIDRIFSLMAKNKEKRVELLYSRSAYGTDKSNMSQSKTDEFKYPCVYGLTRKDGLKIWYSNTKENGHFGIKKIIIPNSKCTLSHYDKNGEYGICQFAFGIKVDSDKEAKIVEDVLNSKEFDDIWCATEWVYNTKNWQIMKYLKKDFWKEFIS